MEQRLYIGFKGNNNASSTLVRYLSKNPCLLTNSFGGVKQDIENLADYYDYVLLFGVDKNLRNSVRIERVAEREGICLLSDLDLSNRLVYYTYFLPPYDISHCHFNYVLHTHHKASD